MANGQIKEKIPKQYRDFVRLIGLEGTIRLLSEYGGSTAYMPKVDGLKAARRRIEIRREYNGMNADAVARKYGVTKRYVQMLAKEKK